MTHTHRTGRPPTATQEESDLAKQRTAPPNPERWVKDGSGYRPLTEFRPRMQVVEPTLREENLIANVVAQIHSEFGRQLGWAWRREPADISGPAGASWWGP